MEEQTTEVEPSWYREYSQINEVVVNIKVTVGSGEFIKKRFIFIFPKKIRQLHNAGGIIGELIEQALTKIAANKHIEPTTKERGGSC